jgi:hypothetical protein
VVAVPRISCTCFTSSWSSIRAVFLIATIYLPGDER